MPLEATTAFPPTPLPRECNRRAFSSSPIDSVLQKLGFPLQLAMATVVIVFVFVSMMRRNVRNVGRLTLFVLGVIEALLFTISIPASLGAFQSWYSDESFRRFYIRSVVPIQSASNMLSTADAFLTVLVVYEFYLFAVESPKKKYFCTVRRQCIVYAIVLAFSIAIGALSFYLHNVIPSLRCAGKVMAFRYERVLDETSEQLVQLFQAVVMILLPSLAVWFINRRLVRVALYQTLPTENKELMSEGTDGVALRRLEFTLNCLTAAFVVPHVLSFIPIVSWHTFPYFFAVLATVCNMLLRFGKIISFYLLHSASLQLAEQGVHFY